MTRDKDGGRAHRVYEALASGSGGVAAKQCFYFGFVLLISALLAISASPLVSSPQYLVGLGILTLATIVAAISPWPKIDRRWAGLLPVVNIGVAGALRDVFRDDAPAVALLAFLPAVWLAFFFLQSGTVIAAIAVTVSLSLPTLLRAFPLIDSVLITRSMLIPLAVAQICFMVALARRRALDERKRTQQALHDKDALLSETKTQEQLLKNIIDTVDIGLVVINCSGGIVLENSAYRELEKFASSSSAKIGESTLIMRYPNTEARIPDHQRPLHRAADRETFKNNVIAYGGSNGRGRKISSSARQIIGLDGERSGAVVVFADVTAYFDAARRQNQFVAAVSHELRTPLTSIIGYLDLVIDGEELSDNVSANLDVVLRNSEQLLKIVEDLLGTQTVRDNGVDLAREVTDVSELTRRACETMAPAANDKQIELELRIDETPSIAVDPARLTQAVINLLSNAIKYTSAHGTVSVTVSSNHAEAEIAIGDTGIGMTDEEQTNLFTEYYRTPSAKNHHIPGHGLGLSITRLIVLAHRGQISVRSIQGRGSTFTIRLPLT
ncbi:MULTISPECIES: ATP-binding protein [unclassified Brevibacterium]|uniref:sensor histidine kinase n=1 Tax=unclassified Brevibacterium TaxID=2614124 RepID=UPI001E49C4B5|nr:MULTISPECIES: ATP-binding protein [unclassified Brevibacterium]MCD1287586.1 hypothetical protein [Brevibacterium sp. CCUG 69071]MDK8436605.1 ATP-binding protein [Brevibacterium sp. H-BE7]